MRGERIRHLEIRHGGEGKADQSLADVEDIGRLGYVTRHFDSISIPVDENGPVFSDQYIDKHNAPAPLVEIRTRIDGTYVVEEAVPDSKWRKIYIESARIEKSKEP